MRILHIDDQPFSADSPGQALSPLLHGCTVDSARTSAEAQERLTSPEHYDVVLIDLEHSGQDGLALISRIRELVLPLGVIMLSRSDRQDGVIAALRLGADDFVLKDRSNPADLLPRLRRARMRARVATATRTRALRLGWLRPIPEEFERARTHVARSAPHIRLAALDTVDALVAPATAGAEATPTVDALLLDDRPPGLAILDTVSLVRSKLGEDIAILILCDPSHVDMAVQATYLDADGVIPRHAGYLHHLTSTLERLASRFHRATEFAAGSGEEAGRPHPPMSDGGAHGKTTAERTDVSGELTASLQDTQLAVLRGLALSMPLPLLLERLRADMETLLPTAQVTIGLADHVTAGARHVGHESRFPLLDDDGAQVGTVAVRLPEGTSLTQGDLKHIHECVGLAGLIVTRTRAHDTLRRAATVFEFAKEGAIVTDLDSHILAVNRAYSEITGYAPDEVLGRKPSLLQSGRQDPSFYQTLWASITATGHWRGEIWNRRKNGELYPQLLSISAVYDAQHRPTHYVGIMTDISQLKEAEARLEHLVHFDPLTDLPNRRLVQSRLQHALDRADRQRHQIAVLFLDLDGFKQINDRLGHPVGDDLLAALADRLVQRLREDDTIGRLGGDEFLILLENLDRPEDAAGVAQTILKMLETPFVLKDGLELLVGASIGISLYPSDGGTVAELIRHADAAMYQAKQQGRNTYRFYTPALADQASKRQEREASLRQALIDGGFVLHYQPQVHTTTGHLIGCEVLVRWRKPEGELLLPEHFLPLAEETGLIVQLGDWVLRSACEQGRRWLDRGMENLMLSINLSTRQLHQMDFPERLTRILEETGLPGRHLTFELTESTIMVNGDHAPTLLKALKDLGVRLSIDDFGTGYSSLARLQHFPIDELKIDQGFIQSIQKGPTDREIAATIIGMARSLNLTVVAEGVETPEQLAYLASQGCHVHQGFLLAQPLSADAFWALAATLPPKPGN